MAFCSGCGAEVADGTITCSKCGKTVSQSVGGGAAVAPAPAAQSSSGIEPNIAGLLCYSPVGLLASIFFLVADPYKNVKFIKFHALQSLFTAGAMMAVFIGLGIVGAVVSMVFAPLALLLIPINLLIGFGSIGLFIWMMISAYQNKTTKLPIVGAIAAKNAGI